MTPVRDLHSGRIPSGEVGPPTNRSREGSFAGAVLLLQQALTAVFGLRLSRVTAAWPSVFMALALLLTGPAGIGVLAESQETHDGCSNLGESDPLHRLVDPIGCQLDGEASLADIAEEAEESETEKLTAADHVECLTIPQCPSNASGERHSSYVAIKVEEWLRDHHAPRGPPLS